MQTTILWSKPGQWAIHLPIEAKKVGKYLAIHKIILNTVGDDGINKPENLKVVYGSAYSITHLPTGKKIIDTGLFRVAKLAFEYLEPDADFWDFNSEVISDEVAQEIKNKVMFIRENYVNGE